MDQDDRVRDSLPVNEPYDGLLAEAYDVWLPPDGRYYDREPFRDLIHRGDGPALELGCGNGRLLLGYLNDGLDVEGVDSSADMLEICRLHAEAAGQRVTLHHADWTTLDLGRQYATVYNPAGSFALIHDAAVARKALITWRAHVRPGGRLVIAMGEPDPDRRGDWEWRVRRSATRASDGVTFMVHEALTIDQPNQIEHVLNRHEVWNPDGTLRTTYMRRHRLRWWTQEQLTAALRDCGYVDVKTAGDAAAFLALARRG